ncbi:pentatricopeptide repeat-containing protein [Tripterygium wilfordii]|uniref:Pentatricopeptide repeat-containing protein n=2 Tax=Tripterygium wilfordii TaxID=458696 RepID=A0A7J7C9L2_TRIWF|nr:pentatricopeptide repeat-containing protein [Tripterygium wilfordii]
MTTTVATAIIDMYSKCGSIECGYQMFQEMPRRDVVAWGAIISGFAAYGQAWKCFELLDEMVADGIHPNEVVFVGILTACSHGGYVRKGQQYFNRMVNEFGIRPTIEHYGCMVDLLGRAGMLAEADELIMSMPEEPNAVIWGSLLHACRMHNDLRRGYRAYKRSIELEPSLGDRYKLASLMFANAGEKEIATNIRKLIKKRELETLRGSSFIEVDGNVHEFVAGDINHQEMREIQSIW